MSNDSNAQFPYPPMLLIPRERDRGHMEYRTVALEELASTPGWSLVFVYQTVRQIQTWDHGRDGYRFEHCHYAVISRDIEDLAAKLQKELEEVRSTLGQREVDIFDQMRRIEALEQQLEGAKTERTTLANLLTAEREKADEAVRARHKIERGLSDERKKLDKLKAVLGSERFEQIINEKKPTSPG